MIWNYLLPFMGCLWLAYGGIGDMNNCMLRTDGHSSSVQCESLKGARLPFPLNPVSLFIGPGSLHSQVYLAIVNTDFCSFLLCWLLFTNFGGSQKAEFRWATIFWPKQAWMLQWKTCACASACNCAYTIYYMLVLLQCLYFFPILNSEFQFRIPVPNSNSEFLFRIPIQC